MVQLTRRDGVPRERRRAGLTLIEVMVALGILGTGLLAASAAQIYAMHGTRSGRHTSDAAELAHTQIETFQRVAWNDLAQTAGWTPAGGQIMNTQVATSGAPVVEQAYSLQWRITDTVSPTGVFLKTIDVRVQWDEPNRPGRSFTITTMRHNDATS